MDRQRPDLGRIAAGEIAALLDGVPVGSPIAIDSGARLRSTLERLIPALLRGRHPEWEAESLDGFSFASAVKTGARAAKLTGTCILISDQCLTPFSLEVRLTEADQLGWTRIRLGEAGGGSLGISGPGYGSRAAGRLLHELGARITTVRWAYDEIIDESANGSTEEWGVEFELGPSLHDATLRVLAIENSMNGAVLRAVLSPIDRPVCVAVFSGLREIRSTRRDAWGPSDAINDASLTRTGEGEMQWQVEMQSGDAIQVTATAVHVEVARNDGDQLTASLACAAQAEFIKRFVEDFPTGDVAELRRYLDTPAAADDWQAAVAAVRLQGHP